MDEVQEYSYETTGFNKSLRRPLGRQGSLRTSAMSRGVNFDQNQVSGALGSTYSFGNVSIDGVNGRIIISDDAGRDRIYIGRLPDNDHGISVSKEGYDVADAY